MTATVPAQQYDDALADMAALRERLTAVESQLEATQHQLDWFKRQLFGAKSEKRVEIDPAATVRGADTLVFLFGIIDPE